MFPAVGHSTDRTSMRWGDVDSFTAEDTVMGYRHSVPSKNLLQTNASVWVQQPRSPSCSMTTGASLSSPLSTGFRFSPQPSHGLCNGGSEPLPSNLFSDTTESKAITEVSASGDLDLPCYFPDNNEMEIPPQSVLHIDVQQRSQGPISQFQGWPHWHSFINPSQARSVLVQQSTHHPYEGTFNQAPPRHRQSGPACPQLVNEGDLDLFKARLLRARPAQITACSINTIPRTPVIVQVSHCHRLPQGQKTKESAISTPPQRRTPHRKICVPCQKDGLKKYEFRGQHELDRHNNRCHPNNRSRWICLDPTVDKRHSWCKNCKQGKQYNVNYNAAEHLRRAHVNPDGSQKLRKKARSKLKKSSASSQSSSSLSSSSSSSFPSSKTKKEEKLPTIQNLIRWGWMRLERQARPSVEGDYSSSISSNMSSPRSNPRHEQFLASQINASRGYNVVNVPYTSENESDLGAIRFVRGRCMSDNAPNTMSETGLTDNCCRMKAETQSKIQTGWLINHTAALTDNLRLRGLMTQNDYCGQRSNDEGGGGGFTQDSDNNNHTSDSSNGNGKPTRAFLYPTPDPPYPETVIDYGEMSTGGDFCVGIASLDPQLTDYDYHYRTPSSTPTKNAFMTPE